MFFSFFFFFGIKEIEGKRLRKEFDIKFDCASKLFKLSV